MRTHAGDGTNSVISSKAESGKTLAAVGVVDGFVLDYLVLQVLVILAVLIGNGAHFFGGLGGQIAERGAIDKVDLLAGIKTDFAFEQNQLLVEIILSIDLGLLL